MKRRVVPVVLAATGLAVGMMAAASAANGPFSLPLGGATGGGGMSTDGRYRLTGAAGQPSAGVFVASRFTVEAGVLAGAPDRVRRFLPAITRDP